MERKVFECAIRYVKCWFSSELDRERSRKALLEELVETCQRIQKAYMRDQFVVVDKYESKDE